MRARLRTHALRSVMIGLSSVLAATPAWAQTLKPVEVFLSLNAGSTQPATTTLSRSTVIADPPDRDEINTDLGAGNGLGFDVGGGVVVRRRFFVGLATSRYTDSQPGTVTVTASHPAFHPTLTASGQTEALKRSESRVDLQFGYVLPNTGRFVVILFGGPSRFDVSQEMVTGLEVFEQLDAATGTFRLVGPSAFEIAKEKASGWGYNVGADASYMLTRTVGVGGLVRYSSARLDLGDPIDSLVEDRPVTKEFDAGGLQLSGGIRFRF